MTTCSKSEIRNPKSEKHQATYWFRISDFGFRISCRGILRHSPWDAVLVVLATAHGVLLLVGAWSEAMP